MTSPIPRRTTRLRLHVFAGRAHSKARRRSAGRHPGLRGSRVRRLCPCGHGSDRRRRAGPGQSDRRPGELAEHLPVPVQRRCRRGPRRVPGPRSGVAGGSAREPCPAGHRRARRAHPEPGGPAERLSVPVRRRHPGRLRRLRRRRNPHSPLRARRLSSTRSPPSKSSPNTRAAATREADFDHDRAYLCDTAGTDPYTGVAFDPANMRRGPHRRRPRGLRVRSVGMGHSPPAGVRQRRCEPWSPPGTA